MASSEANPNAASTSSTPRARYPFGINIYSSLGDDPAASSPSDSLDIGPKGESPFPRLGELSSGWMTPKVASSSPGQHGSQEDQPNFSQDAQFPAVSSPSISPRMNSVEEYPASRDFTDNIPQLPSPLTDIQGDRPVPYTPPGSHDLAASLQILTLDRRTGNEEFKMVDEMYVHFSNTLKGYVVILSSLVGIRAPTSTKLWSILGAHIHLPSTDDLVCNLFCA
jgi:hypothetical protein